MAPTSDASGSSQKTGGHKSDKYILVHFYDNYRWGAWVREPKVRGRRLYVGTHLTERLAARCQDRALLRLEMEASSTQPIKLNFDRRDYNEDDNMRSTLSRADFVKYLRGESRGSYNKYTATACLIKFMNEERVLGNLATEGALAICAPPKPASKGKGSTSKSPQSRNRKQQQKETNYKEYSSDEEAGQYSSECEEGPGNDQGHDDLSTENNNVAILPSVHAPEPLAAVAPPAIGPSNSLTWAGKRRRSTVTFAEPLATVAPAPLPPVAPAQDTGKRSRCRQTPPVMQVEFTWTEEEEEIMEVLMIDLFVAPRTKESRVTEAGRMRRMCRSSIHV